MRTANEMYEYCVSNGFCAPNTPKYIESFQILIDDYLEPSETVLLPLTICDVFEEDKPVMSGGYVVAAFTNFKRVICCNKAIFSKKTRVKIIKLSATNDIQLTRGSFMYRGVDRITVDSIRDKTGFQSYSKFIDAMFPQVLNIFKSYQWEVSSINAINSTVSSADEILKYKNLLDLGVITQEEFDAKKKQLLGLCSANTTQPETQKQFTCYRCGNLVNFGDPNCKNCGAPFDWSKI